MEPYYDYRMTNRCEDFVLMKSSLSSVKMNLSIFVKIGIYT